MTYTYGAMVEGYWQEIAETTGKEEQSKYHTVHRKAHTDWPGIEHGPVCPTKLFKSKAHWTSARLADEPHQ
jgi:hypothetical protein